MRNEITTHVDNNGDPNQSCTRPTQRKQTAVALRLYSKLAGGSMRNDKQNTDE